MGYEPYKKYTHSNVEWLGQIPSGWQELRLKFVGDAIIGLTYAPDDITDESSGTLVLRANNIQDRKLVSNDPVFVAVDAAEKLYTKDGDILICSRNGSRHLIGKNAIVTGDFVGCYFGAFNTLFRSPVNDFLFHVFNSSLFEFQSGSYLTATINQLTLGALNSFIVPIPPPEEQQQIAAFLDWKTGQIDALIGKKKELLEKLKEKRIAVITQAVTQGLNPAAPMRDSGIPWLGRVPEHWEVMRFGYRTNIQEGQIDPEEEPYSEMLLIAPNHIESDTGRIYDITSARDQSAISGKYLVRRGDVVYSKIRPHLNKCAYANFDGLCSADMYPIRTEQDVSSGFLLFWMLAQPFLDYATESSMRVAMPKLNRDTLNAAPLVVPPVIEQIAIVEHIHRETTHIDAMADKVVEAIDRLTEYRTALITAATTGKIDVRKVNIPKNSVSL